MELKKNSWFLVEIIDMSDDGAGIGKTGVEESGIGKQKGAKAEKKKIESTKAEKRQQGDKNTENRKTYTIGEGYTWFIKDAVIGDIVEASVMKMKKSYGFAKLQRIVRPSAQRIEARCPVARQCGGCQLQMMDYEGQLNFKERKVYNHLKRIGGVDYLLLPKEEAGAEENIKEENAREEKICGGKVRMEPIIGMENPWRYRNKAQFPFGEDGTGRIITGFYAGRTHDIIESEDCLLGIRENKEILSVIRQFMEDYGIKPYCESTQKGFIRHTLIRKGFSTGEIMVCLVINGSSFPYSSELVKRLKNISNMSSISYNINTEKTNVIMGDRVCNLYGPGFIMDSIGDVKYQISPLSFYQVNPIQTKRLYETALEYADLKGNEAVWDLYCGIGTISLFLARKAKYVYGVEIIPQAIEDARRNAALNHINNVEFFVGKAEEVLPEQYEKNHIYADVMVVDPPRKGCDEICLDTIVKMSPKRVVYVSCNSATLARDVKYLGERGYQVERVRCCDMFPQGGHVETIVCLSHKSPDSVINVKVEFGEGEGKVPLDAIAERAKKYQPKPKITYKMIQEYVEKKYAFKVHTAYIEEVKRSLGLTMYDAPNAVEELKHPRKRPPKEKVEAITDALKYFEVI